ncbi:hypothetical protein ABK040_009299 [Willaertia magna]
MLFKSIVLNNTCEKDIINVWNRTSFCKLVTCYVPTLRFVLSSEEENELMDDNNSNDKVVHCCGYVDCDNAPNVLQNDKFLSHRFVEKEFTIIILDLVNGCDTDSNINLPNIKSNIFLFGSIINTNENYLKEKSLLVKFCCEDLVDSYLKYIYKSSNSEDVKMLTNGYLFLNNSNKHSLFEIIKGIFETPIKNYLQNKLQFGYFKLNNDKNKYHLVLHLCLGFILFNKHLSERKINNVQPVAHTKDLTFFHYFCQPEQDETMWNILQELINNKIQQFKQEYNKRNEMIKNNLF